MKYVPFPIAKFYCRIFPIIEGECGDWAPAPEVLGGGAANPSALGGKRRPKVVLRRRVVTGRKEQSEKRRIEESVPRKSPVASLKAKFTIQDYEDILKKVKDCLKDQIREIKRLDTGRTGNSRS